MGRRTPRPAAASFPVERPVSFFRHGASAVNCVPFSLPACPFDLSVNWTDGASGVVQQADGERSYEYDRWNLGTYILSAPAPIFVDTSRRWTASCRLGCWRPVRSAGVGARRARTLAATSGGTVYGGGRRGTGRGQRHRRRPRCVHVLAFDSRQVTAPVATESHQLGNAGESVCEERHARIPLRIGRMNQ